jgi:hypothetical protein
VLPGKSKGSRLAFPRTAKVGADSWLRWRSRLPVRYRIRSLETVGGAYNCGAWYAARNNTDPLLFVLSTNRSRISLCPSAASRRSRLGHFLGCCWFWRSDHGGPKLGTHSALKPNLPQVRVLLAHSLIVSCARPFKTFFSPYPIVNSRRHRARPSLCPKGYRHDLDQTKFGTRQSPLPAVLGDCQVTGVFTHAVDA